MCFSLRVYFRYVANYSVRVLFIVDIFVNGLICAVHSFIHFIKLVDSIKWAFICIHILFFALCAFASLAAYNGEDDNNKDDSNLSAQCNGRECVLLSFPFLISDIIVAFGCS